MEIKDMQKGRAKRRIKSLLMSKRKAMFINGIDSAHGISFPAIINSHLADGFRASCAYNKLFFYSDWLIELMTRNKKGRILEKKIIFVGFPLNRLLFNTLEKELTTWGWGWLAWEELISQWSQKMASRRTCHCKEGARRTFLSGSLVWKNGCWQKPQARESKCELNWSHSLF